MDDLGKALQQRVRHIVRERRIRIKVGERLYLEFKAFAAEVIVNKVKRSGLGGIGRVDGRKCGLGGCSAEFMGLSTKVFGSASRSAILTVCRVELNMCASKKKRESEQVR